MNMCKVSLPVQMLIVIAVLKGDERLLLIAFCSVGLAAGGSWGTLSVLNVGKAPSGH